MDEADEEDMIVASLATIRARLADRGYCLHIQESTALSRTKVYREIFLTDSDDDSNGDGNDT